MSKKNEFDRNATGETESSQELNKTCYDLLYDLLQDKTTEYYKSLVFLTNKQNHPEISVEDKIDGHKLANIFAQALLESVLTEIDRHRAVDGKNAVLLSSYFSGRNLEALRIEKRIREEGFLENAPSRPQDLFDTKQKTAKRNRQADEFIGRYQEHEDKAIKQFVSKLTPEARAYLIEDVEQDGDIKEDEEYYAVLLHELLVRNGCHEADIQKTIEQIRFRFKPAGSNKELSH